MTGDRIDLAALRQQASNAQNALEYLAVGSDYPEAIIAATPDTVLALIDAVEAARAYMSGHGATAQRYDDGTLVFDYRTQQAALRALARALERFTPPT